MANETAPIFAVMTAPTVGPRSRNGPISIATMPVRNDNPSILPPDRPTVSNSLRLRSAGGEKREDISAGKADSRLVDVSSARPEFRSSLRIERSWQISAWAIARAGPGDVSLATNGQLGGSQAGLRASRAILDAGARLRLLANTRFSTPLMQARGKEAAFGLALRRSGGVPVEVLLERRQAIDSGGRNAFAILAATGVSEIALPLGLRLNGYGQAGMVGTKQRDLFADGSIQVEREIARKGGFSIGFGGGAWGAAQPRVSRLDVGPFVAARFRLGRASVRLSSEWRKQVSGNALPGSGPAVSLGLDY